MFWLLCYLLLNKTVFRTTQWSGEERGFCAQWLGERWELVVVCQVGRVTSYGVRDT